jgi:glutamyl-tRNA reductase
MVFVACGLNHKTAPIAVRERFTLSAGNTLLHRLSKLHAVHEVAVLSTCNRTEIYCETTDPDQLIPWLADEVHAPLDEIKHHFYRYHDTEALRHLLYVASGLDSMMLGEPQILGQLKRAYLIAQEAGTIKKNLHPLFQYTFSATKRVRTQSGIGKNPISIAYAAAQLIIQQFKVISSLKIFIIGSGETASLIAKYLHQNGAQHFMIANRTQEHAQHLATQFNAQALSITDIPHFLPEADVVISATSCPLPFINKQLIERALAKRHNALMFLLDLAMPRDIEPNVAELDAVRLYNIDDLHNIVGEGMEERRACAVHAEQLIQAELDNFMNEKRTSKANKVITNYRHQMKQLAGQELQRAQQQLIEGKCQHSVLVEFGERLFNKLTHLPTLGLKQVAFEERVDLLDLMQYLLNKNPEQSLP